MKTILQTLKVCCLFKLEFCGFTLMCRFCCFLATPPFILLPVKTYKKKKKSIIMQIPVYDN